MSKFNFNLNGIYLYEWVDLWWFEYELQIGLWSLRDLIVNQEEVYLTKIADFLNNKEKRIAEIPDEYKDSYEQQFFEDGDRTFTQLIQIQRNAICLSFFSYIEGKFMTLVKMMENEFKLKYKKGNKDILSSFEKYIVDSCKVDGKVFKIHFRNIQKQRIVRNTIAHNNSKIKDSSRFVKVEGIKLKKDEIIICDVIYLNNLISWTELFFKELFIAIDKRLVQVKTKSK